MTKRSVSAKGRGRHGSVLIERPHLTRIRGEVSYRAAWSRYERELSKPPGGTRTWESHPPKRGRNDIERGLIYASRGGAISPQSVGPMLERSERFREWLFREKPARGPAPDIDECVKLFVAIEVIQYLRRRRQLDETETFASEVSQAWELLHGGQLERGTLKQRLNRLKPRLTRFRIWLERDRKLRKTCPPEHARKPFRGP